MSHCGGGGGGNGGGGGDSGGSGMVDIFVESGGRLL